MTTASYAGTDVSLDAEGFFTEPDRWTDAMAADIAAGEGIGELTEQHWRVLKIMRREYETTGNAPNVRALAKASGVPIKDLYRLFPKGPAKLAAKIAGVPKPHGCI